MNVLSAIMQTIGGPFGVRRRRLLPALSLVALLAAFCPFSACAMDFELNAIPGSNDARVLSMLGRIVPGDFSRLADFEKPHPTFGRVILNSEGGNVFEAVRLAELIHGEGDVVIVPDGAVCVSACFLLFAAGRNRVAGPTASIGVHSVSVSVNGDETPAALGLTTSLARVAAAYGVPPSIIRKLVTTPPGRITWLSRADLTSMGVKVMSWKLPPTKSQPQR